MNGVPTAVLYGMPLLMAGAMLHGSGAPWPAPEADLSSLVNAVALGEVPQLQCVGRQEGLDEYAASLAEALARFDGAGRLANVEICDPVPRAR